MVGKNVLNVVLTLSTLLAALPIGPCAATTRAFERYDMDTLPPQDSNGNFTLDDDDQWDITGQGVLEGNITMFDESVIIVDNANITVNGTIWAKDNSKIIIRSSNLTMEVPSAYPVVVEKQYDGPHGFMLIEDGASITIENSDLHLVRHQIYEDPGDLMVPGEVLVNFGDFYMGNSYLDTVGSIDYGWGRIALIRGIVMHMNCELNIINSSLVPGIVFYVNSHGAIENTTFRSISMQKNTEESLVIISNSTITHTITIDEVSNTVFNNCELESCLIVKGHGKAILYDTNMGGLKMLENGTVIMDDSEFLIELPLYLGWNHIQDNSNLTLRSSSFIKTLYLFDNSTISLTNSSMNTTILTDNSSITLEGSSIDNLTAEGTATVWLEGSEIGNYTLANDTKICNITTLAVTTSLNRQPIQIPVSILDETGEILASSETDERGKTSFILVRDMIWFNMTSKEMEYSPVTTYVTVEGDHENLHSEKGTAIEGDYVEVTLVFEDYSAPVMDDVRFETDPFFNTNEKVLVSVHVEDEETSLANVALRYSVDGGVTWGNISLYNTGQNVYENSIPGQSDGTKVRFYIVAEDKCGNTVHSRYYAYTVGESVVLVNNLIIITGLTLVFGIIALMTIRGLWHKSKEKKFIHRAEK